ncbi:hypothetical protein BN2476_70004 [Paraburkholderia piptadeniae]|uniref:Uncharacterized protein n=1 Tax=Paraburkholderia piptadeniae TaxID=1701573 RepID=A0A1N7RL37_9BURK|nr:hypothetical protein BN2476_70004 [Paraburkholderia piptadeniae]
MSPSAGYAQTVSDFPHTASHRVGTTNATFMAPVHAARKTGNAAGNAVTTASSAWNNETGACSPVRRSLFDKKKYIDGAFNGPFPPVRRASVLTRHHRTNSDL